MMAIERDDDELPAPIAEALVDVGLAPEAATLKELIASLPRLLTDAKRVVELEREAENRRLQWPLLGLIPSHVNAEVARRAAAQGLLVAERIGGRWFASVSSVETWLQQTGRWFKSEAEEQRWRKMLADRKVQ